MVGLHALSSCVSALMEPESITVLPVALDQLHHDWNVMLVLGSCLLPMTAPPLYTGTVTVGPPVTRSMVTKLPDTPACRGCARRAQGWADCADTS
jgi:hypothetical protein